MRVLFFSRDYTTHDRRFLAALAARDLEVHFLRLEDRGLQLERRPLPQGVSQVEWSGHGKVPIRSQDDWIGILPALDTAIAKVKPELVHAGPVHSSAFLAAVLGCRPLVAMSWGSDLLVEAEGDPLIRWCAGYALQRTDLFACDAAAVLKKARQLARIDSFIQFPWGIDTSTKAAATNLVRDLGWNDKTVIICTRAWEQLYGIDVLLKAFAIVASDNADLRLILLSTGSMREFVQEFIRQHGLEEKVSAPGQLPPDEVLACFQAADIYVSCAASDGTSISLLEAMAAGLPVIVTDIESNREWVETGTNGWLTVPGDPRSVASALSSASALSESERRIMADRNRAVVKERADWETNMDALVARYRQLVAASC